MVDVETLKSTIDRKGESVESVANAIGIDKSTFYRRLSNGGEDFSIAEVNGICDFLKLTQKDKKLIFFTKTVA